MNTWLLNLTSFGATLAISIQPPKCPLC